MICYADIISRGCYICDEQIIRVYELIPGYTTHIANNSIPGVLGGITDDKDTWVLVHYGIP